MHDFVNFNIKYSFLNEYKILQECKRLQNAKSANHYFKSDDGYFSYFKEVIHEMEADELLR